MLLGQFAACEVSPNPHLHCYLTAWDFFLSFNSLAGGENKPYQDPRYIPHDCMWRQRDGVSSLLPHHGSQGSTYTVRLGGLRLYLPGPWRNLLSTHMHTHNVHMLITPLSPCFRSLTWLTIHAYFSHFRHCTPYIYKSNVWHFPYLAAFYPAFECINMPNNYIYLYPCLLI